MHTPRLRMFAGPNGSGKSTIKSVVPESLLGIYINPDEIQKEAAHSGYLVVQNYSVETSPEEILEFFTRSVLLQRAGLAEAAGRLRFNDGRLDFRDLEMNAYFASVAADFLRQKLLEKQASFSFETVMSSPDKVALLEKARQLGYRTYLYYIATDDPSINVARVKARVSQGGHNVPESKIIQRYHRSLEQLMDAVKFTSRCYIFDNSRHGGERLWVAEITDGQDLELKCDPMPLWFQKALWSKIQPGV